MAAHCPWNAPKNFYEALNLLAFFRKAAGALRHRSVRQGHLEPLSRNFCK